MGKIVISTNVSLDGVVQDPDGEEGFRLGGWFGQFGGKDLEEWAKVELEEALGTEALLLGRRSDEWFATRWASRTGEWADRLNSLPKYVVSSTLQEPKWNNSTVLPRCHPGLPGRLPRPPGPGNRPVRAAHRGSGRISRLRSDTGFQPRARPRPWPARVPGLAA